MSRKNIKAGHTYWTRRAITWAEERVKDKKTTGRLVRLSCQRFLDDFTSGKWAWSDVAVDDCCQFLELLPPPTGEQFGDTMVLFDWQVFFVANIEGFRVKGTGDRRKGLAMQRRFSEAYLGCARKVGKTSFAAGLALYDLCGVRKGSRQVLAATTKDQAMETLLAANSSAGQSKILQQFFQLKVGEKGITRGGKYSGRLYPVAGDPKALDGKRPTLVILDEIHALKDNDLFSVLSTALGSTYNPLMIMTTTAGFGYDSVGRNIRDVAVKVLEGKEEMDNNFVLNFEADEDDDPYKESTWRKVNPGIGLTIPLSYYKREAARAKQSPDLESFFFTRQINRWLQSAKDAWLHIEDWDACQDTQARIEDYKDCPLVIGLDMAEVNDLTGMCMLFKLPDGGLRAFFRAFAPQMTIDKNAEKGLRAYNVWQRGGHLEACGQARIEVARIAKMLSAYHEEYNLMRVICDPAVSVDDFSGSVPDELQGRIRNVVMSAPAVSPSSKDIAARVEAHEGLLHDGHPVARWCISNTIIRVMAMETILPRKTEDNPTAKVDLSHALILANMGMMVSDVGSEMRVPKGSADIPDDWEC